jgi:hypothetical protein
MLSWHMIAAYDRQWVGWSHLRNLEQGRFFRFRLSALFCRLVISLSSLIFITDCTFESLFISVCACSFWAPVTFHVNCFISALLSPGFADSQGRRSCPLCSSSEWSFSELSSHMSLTRTTRNQQMNNNVQRNISEMTRLRQLRFITSCK